MAIRRLTWAMVLAMTAGLATTSAWADDKPVPPPEVPAGWVAVQSEFWIPLIDEPSNLFHRVRERFMDKDFTAAARDLRAAASRVRMEARRATQAEQRTALYTASWRLTRLANDVKAKNIRSVLDLDREFARAHYALAEHDYALVRDSWKNKLQSTAGHNLSAAIRNAESAFGWLHEPMSAAAANSTLDGTAMAAKLIAKSSPSQNDFDTTITGVGEAIRDLGRVIKQTPVLVAEEEAKVTLSTPPTIAGNWIVVDENVWYDLSDAVGRELHDAYEARLRNDNIAAATALRKAASDLQIQISRATGEDRTALMTSMVALRNLADGTQDPDASATSRRYQKTIAETCCLLARHHCEQAEQAWKAKAIDTSGFDLQAATDYLERGMVWAGQYADTNTETQLRAAREAANELISGTPCEEQDVMNALNTIQSEVERLRTAVANVKA